MCEEATKMAQPLKVLIVGAGTTGALTSCLLKRAFNDQIRLEVWDKSRGIGGRMTSSRMSRESSLSLDLGAQYISATQHYLENHKSLYEELLAHDVLKPLDGEIIGMRNSDDGTHHFVTPKGSSSIPKHFLKQAACPVKNNQLVHGVGVLADTVQTLTTNSDGDNAKEISDVVILTIPVPQILRLSGDIPSLITPFRKTFEAISYSSRYALGLFFPDVESFDQIDWCGKYVDDDPCIRYVSIDTKKRQTDPSEGMSVVVHTSVPWSIKHLENSFEEVEPIILEHLHRVVPELPETSHKKILRWRYSQVSKPYQGEPGCFVLNKKPLILCAGDGFSHSNFDGCIDSANSVVETIRNMLETK